VIGPNEAAVIIRDGEIETTLTGTRSNTSGLWDNFKKLWGRSSDLQVIYVDTAPIDLTFYIGKSSRQETGTEIGKLSESREDAYKTIEDRTRSRVDKTDLTISALTKDGQHISAEISLTLHVLTNDAQLLTTLLRGGTAIADWDIAALVKDELLAKAFVPIIGQHAGSEIRGNQVLLTQITQSAESLLADKFELFGLELINMYVNWGLTDEDELVIEQGRKEREERGIEFDHTRKIREQERELELDRLRASNLIDLRKLNTEGDAEEAELILAAEINRENLVDGKRVDQARITVEVRDLELAITQKENQLRIDTGKSEADARFAIEQRQALFDQDLKRRSEEGRQQTLTTESQRTMSEMQALSAMHRQKQADRRGSEQANLQTQLDASLKQSELEQRTVRDTMLAAGSADPTVLREILKQGTDRVLQNKRGSGVEDSTYQSASEGESPAPVGPTCKSCSSAIEIGWKVCPSCGTPVAEELPTRAGPVCKSCSSAIEIGWKVCPSCGTPIKRQCRNCSKQLEEGWNSCPFCGLSDTS
jgi:RNA polymerase subunit RPABC4/transcription elongation factor Spt4